MSPARPHVSTPTIFGDPHLGTFWVEYPNGLVDITRSRFRKSDAPLGVTDPREKEEGESEFNVQDERRVRIENASSALVVIDMQNFFLHPDLRAHPSGLACVEPLMKIVPHFRKLGVKIIWCNWGLTETELKTIPPALARSFSKTKPSPNEPGGFGTRLPGKFGRLLMRGEYNSELYGPLQELYLKGEKAGTDVWIHKNRMSGMWGGQSELDLYLQSQGYRTLFWGGVNADQCVLGSVVDAYYKGYDCIMLEDCVATTSPEGGKSNILYNCKGAYGFVTDTESVVAG